MRLPVDSILLAGAMSVVGPLLARTAGTTQAMAAVERYLDKPKPGLWLDRIDASNRLIEEPVTASTLYHIIGAALVQAP